MNSPDSGSLTSTDWQELERRIRARTSARLMQGRVGGCYRTLTQLDLREAHAAARDAVRTELDMEKQFGEELCPGSWFANDERPRGPYAHDVVPAQLFGEDARTKPAMSADVDPAQKNDERHVRQYRR